jgi:DNA-binding MarR family transcriptional regulator
MNASENLQKDCAAQLLELLPWLRHYLGTAVRQEESILLSLLELRVISRLKRFPGISLSALAEDLGINKATASTTVERMVRQELVTREENPNSRREVVLKATRIGLSHLKKSHRLLQGQLIALMDQLTDAELRHLEAGLSVLRKMLEVPYPQLLSEQPETAVNHA